MSIGHNGGPPLHALTWKQRRELLEEIIWARNLSSGQKCIAFAIVVLGDENGEASLGAEDLKRIASINKRDTVFAAKKNLEAQGFIEKVNVPGKANRYRIMPPKVVASIIEAYETQQAAKSTPVPKRGTGDVPAQGMGDVPQNGIDPPERDEPRAPVYARIETPSGLLTPQKLKDNPPLSPKIEFGEDGERITYVNGQIRLFNGLKQFWLEKFGTEERLDLALAQAAGYVQPNNRTKPIEAQVSSQLARMIREKLDKDDRYEKAVKSGAKSASAGERKVSNADRIAAVVARVEAKKGGVRT
jgi:hypothetical protein